MPPVVSTTRRRPLIVVACPPVFISKPALLDGSGFLDVGFPTVASCPRASAAEQVTVLGMPSSLVDKDVLIMR